MSAPHSRCEYLSLSSKTLETAGAAEAAHILESKKRIGKTDNQFLHIKKCAESAETATEQKAAVTIKKVAKRRLSDKKAL